VDDVFELQDQITDKVIGIVEPSVQQSEIERARQKRPENMDAYDLYLRALPYSATRKLADARVATDFPRQALELNPNYAAAHALLALCLQMSFVQGGALEADKAEGLKHARAAITGAGDDAIAITTAAMVLGHLGGDHAAAIEAIAIPLAINPSSATVNYYAAHIHVYAGRFAEGARYADRALRLSPRDPLAFHTYYVYGFKALHEGRYDEAATSFAKVVQITGGAPHAVFAQAAALALAGSAKEGRAIVKAHLDWTPSVTARKFAQTGLTRDIVDLLVEGARLLEAAE